MRIVSLTCSNTEIVCALGCEPMLVGVDNHSDYPAEAVARLPRVGPDLQIDIGKVKALKPDLVLASLTVPGHEKVIDGLRAAGLNFIAPEPTSLEDVYKDVRAIGLLLGVPQRTENVVAAMQAAMASSAGDNCGERPSVLVEWWPKPVIVPGDLSWVTDMLALAGAHNPWGGEQCKSRPVSDDEVIDCNPDAIVIAWCGVQFEKYRTDVVYKRARWQTVRAVREGRVYCVPEAYLGRPSPRLAKGVQALRGIVDEVRGANRAGR